MKAKSIKGKSTAEIKAALEESMADIHGFKPTLGLVFLSNKQDHMSICRVLGDAGIAIFGATTNGEFIDEETHSGSVVILLLDMNPENFTILFEEYNDNDYREKANTAAKKDLEP